MSQPTRPVLIGPSIWDFPDDGISWAERVRGLRIAADSKASKAVPDVTLTWGAKVVVRISRQPKQLYESEVIALANEHEKPVDELIAILTKRKIAILNEAGDQINDTASAAKKRTRSATIKANAKGRASRRKNNSLDQLLEPGTSADLPQEIPLQAEPQANSSN